MKFSKNRQLRYIEVVSGRIKLHYEDKSIFIEGRLDDIEKQFNGGQFLKVHDHYIVNVDQIKKFDGRLLHLEDNKIPVDQNLKQELKTLLLASSI